MTNPMFDSLNAMNDRMLGLVHGVYTAVVTNNKDPEKLGRVKVKIPIIDNEKELDWARIATLLAGNKRGSLFVPEVGDEVLVAFHMGDIREPIVIGALWNKEQKPPEGMDDKNNIRKFHSRMGHQLIFDDKDGDGKVQIKTNAGHKLELLEKTETITLEEKSGNNVLTIKGGSSGEVELKSGTTKITINNKGDVAIKSSKSIKIESPQIQVEAQATLDLKASAALNLKSDGMITIKGSMVKIN